MLGPVLATSNSAHLYRRTPGDAAVYEAGQRGFAALRAQLVRHQPDVLAVIGYDDGTCFSPVQVPQFCTYTGSEIHGSIAVTESGDRTDDHRIRLTCVPTLAWEVHERLIDAGFDMSYMSVQNPTGDAMNGMSSAFMRPPTVLTPNLNVPILPFFINCSVEPMPSGRRCWAFGEALGQILDQTAANIAVLAVGGLSAEVDGAGMGRIDERLDRGVLKRLENGQADRIASIFDLEAATLIGGTGQIRTWIAASATAAGRRVCVVDYTPSVVAGTGIAFAYWPATSRSEGSALR